MAALKNALASGRQGANGGEVITTLIDEFRYPKQGPGMMWERVAELVTAGGSEVRMESSVDVVRYAGTAVTSVDVATPQGSQTVEGTDFISSMPIRELVRKMVPPPPTHVREAADKLKYRDFLTVALVVDDPDLFPDNWIYIHDPDVQVGRIQNFKNWSPYMVPDPSKSCLGLEYFCFEGDGLWTSSDEDLVARARREIAALGLARAEDVVDGCVVRMPKAYPVYDGEYHDAMATLREFFDGFENLQLVGRNGMHRYNNQDHSMLTAMLAVRNIRGARFDLWKVNEEDSYHEEVTDHEAEALSRDLALLNESQPLVPSRVAVSP
jgi:protoporphyrinogen oxidase